MAGFVEFIRKQGVVGLAIAFILGGAVSKVVGSLVGDIINPIIGVLLGGESSLAEMTIQAGDVTIGLGQFVTTVIDFAIIAAVVYFIFKGLKLDRLDVPK